MYLRFLHRTTLTPQTIETFKKRFRLSLHRSWLGLSVVCLENHVAPVRWPFPPSSEFPLPPGARGRLGGGGPPPVSEGGGRCTAPPGCGVSGAPRGLEGSGRRRIVRTGGCSGREPPPGVHEGPPRGGGRPCGGSRSPCIGGGCRRGPPRSHGRGGPPGPAVE